MIRAFWTLRAAVLAGIVAAGISCSAPSEATVRREFLDRYPNAEIKSLELIFEQDGQVVYLVSAKEKGVPQEGKYDFALKQVNWGWEWCDDQTERKCGPIGQAK
ncbi:MAG TPA: hypothetical protein VHL50_09635 [Pyrinomonadaceae bacterium]|jgi:hypothetical protein|nr:hypothetical protein [Pyrinomonadaceae bacterium]